MQLSAWLRQEAYAWSVTATALTPTGPQPFRPYSYQKRLLESTSKRRLILKARQVGISQTVGIEARHSAEFRPGSTTLFVSRTQDLAAELIRYTRGCAPIRRGNQLVRDNAFSLTFENGSRVMAEAATRNAGRGFAATRVYLDEFAFAEYADDIWRSVEPMAAELTVLSTPHGRNNMFYLLWAGEYGDDWDKQIIHWSDCPRYWTPAERQAGVTPQQSAWYRSKRQAYTTRDWASEYECDFVESGGSVFTSALCEAVYDRALPTGDPSTWIHVPGSYTYWDLGARQDATVGVTVAKVAGKLPVIAFTRMEAPNEWPAIERAIADRLARYPDGRHVIESNGIGDPFIAHLRNDLGMPVEEFLVTTKSKADMITALVLSCEQERFRHGSRDLYAEMLRYQLDDAKLVQDCVMAASGVVYAADRAYILLHV